jgi:peptidoglycan-N-acetylglucosamine deacetylase
MMVILKRKQPEAQLSRCASYYLKTMRIVKRAFRCVLLSLLCVVPSASQQVAFTFDDLPSHGDLPPGQTRMDIAESILRTLKEQHLPAVYGFINAARLEAHPDDLAVLKAWRAGGNLLGSHTYSHPSLNDLTPTEFESEIARNEPVLKKLMTGQDWHWFRYPFLLEGNTSEKRHAVRAYLQQNGYQIAQVSLDFEDYLWNAPYARCIAKKDDQSIAALRASYLATADQYITVFRDLTHSLYGRDVAYVLLLHIGAFDAKMLPDLIDLFRRRGFTFTTLPEAMKDPAYGEDPEMAPKYEGAFQEQVAGTRHIKFPPNTKPYKELEAACH